MIIKAKMLWSFIKFLQLILQGSVMEINVENLCEDIVA